MNVVFFTDREEGAAEALAKEGLALVPLFRMSEFTGREAERGG